MAEFTVLGKTFSGEPAKVTPEVLTAVAAGLEEALGKGKSAEEKVTQLTKVLDEELKPQIEKIREEQRELARTVPGPTPKDVPLSLKREGLMFGPSREDAADKDFQGLASMSRGQFSILTRPVNELTDDETTAKALKRYRMLRDVAVVVNARFSELRSQYPDYRGWDSLPFNKELVELEKRFQGVNTLADATAGTGAEWIRSNVLSGQLTDRIGAYTELSNAFVTFPMEAATVKRAARGSRVTTYLVAENTASDGTNAPTISSFGTAAATFTAHKQAGFVEDSEEWDQDSIFSSAQAILDELAYGFAYDAENVLVNGEHTTTTLNQTAAAAGSAVLIADGIRAFYKNATDGSLYAAMIDGSAGLTAEMLATCWAQQGVYGKPQDGLWAVNTNGLARLMLAKSDDGVPVWLRADTLGREAAAITGVIGNVYGSPVMLSSLIPDTMDGTGSIPDAGSVYTGIYHINRKAMQIGERKGITLSASEHYRFLYGQLCYRGIRRWDFQALLAPGTYTLVNAIVKVPTF